MQVERTFKEMVSSVTFACNYILHHGVVKLFYVTRSPVCVNTMLLQALAHFKTISGVIEVVSISNMLSSITKCCLQN